jgi:hypothetical protein
MAQRGLIIPKWLNIGTLKNASKTERILMLQAAWFD